MILVLANFSVLDWFVVTSLAIFLQRRLVAVVSVNLKFETYNTVQILLSTPHWGFSEAIIMIRIVERKHSEIIDYFHIKFDIKN